MIFALKIKSHKDRKSTKIDIVLHIFKSNGVRMNFSKINNLYNLVCVISTIALQIYCLSNYLKDEDVSAVLFTKYHSSQEAIYPSLSLCIRNPFIESKFDRYENDINMTSYIKFLQGNFWDDKMLKVEYDNVSVSLSDNLIRGYYYTHADEAPEWIPDHFVSFRSYQRKCFTINAPFVENKQIWILGVAISNKIYPEGQRRVTDPRKPPNLFTSFHYPGQYFRSYYTVRENWDSRVNKSENYDMAFRIKNIDVITNRDKPNQRCLVNWREHDTYVINNIMREIGCHPPHWTPSINLSMCSNSWQIKKFRAEPPTSKVESFDPPCNHIERLDYRYEETDLGPAINYGYVMIEYYFLVLYEKCLFK